MIGFDSLQIDSPFAYLLAFTFPALDAVLPLVPSESALITLGVATTGEWDWRIVVLVALAAVGAFVGDNVCYLIGRRAGPWVERKFFSTPRGQERRQWAERTLQHYGARLIVGCRFIPGGRTAVTLTCGLTRYPRRRFVGATALAAVIWASYAYLLGRLGGSAFEDRPWIGLGLALGIAVALSLLIEVGRRALRRWRRARAGQAEPAAVPPNVAATDGLGVGSPSARPSSSSTAARPPADGRLSE